MPARAAGTGIRRIGAPHASAAMTVPRWPPKPTSTTPSSPCRSRTSWPTLTIRAGHVGGPGVADVGVVLPHDRLRSRAVVRDEPVQRVGHVAVADVPRLVAAADHRPVVALGAREDLGVLAARRSSASARRRRRPGARGAPRAGRPPRPRTSWDQPGRAGVPLGVLAVRLEAPEGLPRRRRGLRLVLAAGSPGRPRRVPQLVHVEPVEPDVGRPAAVVRPAATRRTRRPPVRPHPRRPAVERLSTSGAPAPPVGALDPAVHAEAVRPVALDRDERSPAR